MQKSDEIAQWLREELLSGRLPPGGKVPSEYELARRFDVNKLTANKAVAVLVSEGLLERRGRGAGTFAKRTPRPRGTIMLLICVAPPYYAQIAHGAQHGALARGYLSYLAAPPPERLNEFLRGLDSSIVQGIITSTYGWIEGPPGVPVVHVDREFPTEMSPHYLINADCRAGAALAAEEMLNRGHRDLVYAGSHLHPFRADGFVAALEAAGFPDARERAFIHPDGPVFRLLQDMLKKFPGLTGVVTGSDDYALALSVAAKRLKLALPGNISMTGFGNVEAICEVLDLTSVEQHPTGLGAFAAERVIDMIEGKRGTERFTELLPCELIRRQSVADLLPQADYRNVGAPGRKLS